ncbi:unnamed protein product [Effrenium voratum]|nr:unnamed protein product [Effrenium voratum]
MRWACQLQTFTCQEPAATARARLRFQQWSATHATQGFSLGRLFQLDVRRTFLRMQRTCTFGVGCDTFVVEKSAGDARAKLAVGLASGKPSGAMSPLPQLMPQQASFTVTRGFLYQARSPISLSARGFARLDLGAFFGISRQTGYSCPREEVFDWTILLLGSEAQLPSLTLQAVCRFRHEATRRACQLQTFTCQEPAATARRARLHEFHTSYSCPMDEVFDFSSGHQSLRLTAFGLASFGVVCERSQRRMHLGL